MASTEGSRAKAVGYLFLWLAALAFFISVLVTAYEFRFGGGRQLSETASDYLAVAGALFSAWAVVAWVLQLNRGWRA